MGEMMFEDPRHRDPLYKIREGLAGLGKSISDLFKTETKETTISTSVTRTSSTYSYPEYEYLSSSERILITSPVELCIGNLRSLVKNSYHVDFDTIYNRIYSIIPDVMVNEMTSSMDSYWNQRYKLFNGNETYEEIMKKFMDMAADINSVPWFIESLASGGGKVYDVVVKLLNRFTSSEHKTLDWDLFPIKPALLALLWAFLLMELTAKYTSSCTSFERARIAKMAISLVLALFAGFTGYVHTGGYTGVPSVTSWVRTLYNSRKWVEKEHPYYASYIPDFLKFSDCSDFDYLTEYKQISAAKGLNMAYTFRVGDSFLDNLSGNGTCSEDVLKKTLKSVWPLPNSYESNKIYRLYTEDKIYYL